MKIHYLLVPLAALLSANSASAQSTPAATDSAAVVDEAIKAVSSDSAAIDALRNDSDASGPDYNRAAMIYHAARSLLESGDAAAATDSAGVAAAVADLAGQGARDLFDRQPNTVGAPPMHDSTVDNTERDAPDGVPQRTFRDSEPFGAGAYTPDGIPQRTFTDSLPFGAEKAQPVDQP